MSIAVVAITSAAKKQLKQLKLKFSYRLESVMKDLRASQVVLRNSLQN